MDYIKINWKKIDADIFHMVARAKEGGEKSFMSKIKKQITHTLPLMGGFMGAFYYSF